MAKLTKSTEPLDFLSYLSSRHDDRLTITDQIFEEETKRFCDKMKEKQASPRPASKLKYIISQTSRENKAKSVMENPVDHVKGVSLPRIPNKKSLKFFSPSARKKFSISKIVKFCEDDLDKGLSKHHFNYLVSKNTFLAREYTKEVMQASNILSEIKEFRNDIKKRLYEEIRTSKDGYEAEKKQVIHDYVKKPSFSKGYRLKKLKYLIKSNIYKPQIS